MAPIRQVASAPGNDCFPGTGDLSSKLPGVASPIGVPTRFHVTLGQERLRMDRLRDYLSNLTLLRSNVLVLAAPIDGRKVRGK